MIATIARKLTPHPALNWLSDRRLLRELAFGDEQWAKAINSASFEVRDPFSGVILAEVANLASDDMTAAIDAAARAFPLWKALLPPQRSDKLAEWYKLIGESREDLALLMTLEQGKTLAESRSEIDYAGSFAQWYSEEAKRLHAETVTSHLAGAQTLVSRKPIGVAALLTPGNFPSAMLTRKAAAALAAGCAHPSCYTPLSALALAALADRARIPPGVFNVVTGETAPNSGRLCEDARVRLVSFTGSTDLGRLIARQCASTVKRLTLELGGNAPLIVFDDAHLDNGIERAIAAKFLTSGQDCLAANRIYVQRSIYRAFVDAFAQRIAALKVGSELDERVDVDPLVHEIAVSRARAGIENAVQRGARMPVGDTRPPGHLFVMPTLLVDVPDEATIMYEEVFAPVAAVAPFDTEAEVVRRTNNTEYGLVAYVFTCDGAHMLPMRTELDYGMITINRVRITGAPIPFGGLKHSGMGREGSRLEIFTDLKCACFDLAS